MPILRRLSTGVTLLNARVQQHPLASSLFFGITTKWSIDLIVQRSEYELKRNTQCSDLIWCYDRKRGASFAFFGALYLGVCQHQIYGKYFPFILSALSAKTPTTRAFVQVCLDQFVVFPAVYFPLFYAIRGATNPPPGADGVLEGLAAGLCTCFENLWPDCTAAWVVWAPIQLANFALVPRHWRAPFVSVTGFAWTAYLSAVRGAQT